MANRQERKEQKLRERQEKEARKRELESRTTEKGRGFSGGIGLSAGPLSAGPSVDLGYQTYEKRQTTTQEDTTRKIGEAADEIGKTAKQARGTLSKLDRFLDAGTRLLHATSDAVERSNGSSAPLPSATTPRRLSPKSEESEKS